MIFVSYSRDDTDFVDKLTADLEEIGLDLWIDRSNIPPGERWDRIAQDALDTCETLLVVLSESSVRSEEVLREVNYALSAKRVIPVLYRQCPVPYRLASLQHVDFTGESGYPLDALVLALKGPSRRPEPPPDPVLTLFAPYLRRFVYEFEHWEEFNEQTSAGPRATRSMMIPKMASADLFREFVPITLDYLEPGGSRTRPGDVRDMETMLIGHAAGHERLRMLLLLGDYGTGKSSCAIHLAYRTASQCLAHPTERRAVPVYIDLRDFRRFGRMEEFLVHLLWNHYQIQLDLRRMRRLLEEGWLLLVFDGFDEMASRGDLHETLSNFREIKRVSFPGAMTILTSRTHYFRSDREAEQVFEGRALVADNPLLQEIRDHPGFVVAQLREFSDDQIRELIARRMGSTQVEQVWAEMTRRYNLSDLARRVVLLDMILTTIPYLLARGDAINVADVYEAYTTLWIDREDWRSNLTPEGKASLMKRLGWNMTECWLKGSSQDKGRSVQNSGILISELLQSVGTILSTWLKPDGGASGYEEERIDYDLRTCSFLRRDSDGRYSFSHRSFLEYFCALHLLDSADIGTSPLLQQCVASYYTQISWEWPSPEIIEFVLSVLRRKPERRARILRLTSVDSGYGGNAVTLASEASRAGLDKNSLGPNLRGCAAYALDLSGCDLTGADLGGAALASPDLEGATLTGSRWEGSAVRIDAVYDATFHPDGFGLLIGSGNGTLTAWNWRTGERTRRVALHTGYVFDMALEPAANLWAFTTWDGRIHLHELEDGAHIGSADGRGAGSGRIVFSHGAGYLAATSWDGWVRMWRCDGPAMVEAGSWQIGGRPTCLVFHPSNEYLVVAAGDVFHRLRLNGLQRALGAGGGRHMPGGGIEAVAFHPDGHLVALSRRQDHRIEVINIESGRLVAQTETPVWNCHALAFSPDGNVLVTGGATGVALIDLSNGKAQWLMECQAFVRRLRFSPDGKLLIAAGFDGVTRIWSFPSAIPLVAIDVGIQCFGANVASAAGFGNLSVRLSAEWERWWAGPALEERLRRCGGISHPGATPRACWGGQEHMEWLQSIRWASTEEAFRARHGRELRDHEARSNDDFLSGAARGTTLR